MNNPILDKNFVFRYWIGCPSGDHYDDVWKSKFKAEERSGNKVIIFAVPVSVYGDLIPKVDAFIQDYMKGVANES